MSQSPGTRHAPAMVMRLSVPTAEGFRDVAADVAVKIAEYLGHEPHNAKSAAAVVEALVVDVVPNGAESGEITFEFHQADGELRIEARCAGRSSEARHPLPT